MDPKTRIASLTIGKATMEDSGKYSCVAYGESGGHATTTANVQVLRKFMVVIFKVHIYVKKYSRGTILRILLVGPTSRNTTIYYFFQIRKIRFLGKTKQIKKPKTKQKQNIC